MVTNNLEEGEMSHCVNTVAVKQNLHNLFQNEDKMNTECIRCFDKEDFVSLYVQIYWRMASDPAFSVTIVKLKIKK